MVSVSRGLVVLVAGGTREDRVVAGIVVAVCTRRPFAAVRAGVDRELVVRKRCARPGRGVVARRTGGRKRGCYVIGIADAGVFRSVTRIAIRRCPCIAAAYMAVGASDIHVCPSQREACFCVIESGRHPGRSAVTDFACLRESSCRMIRVFGVSEIRQMAGCTECAQPGVLTAGMAICARSVHVRARQREQRLCMVEGGAGPGGRGVADGTVCGKCRCYVIRIGGLVKARQMARSAVLRRSRKFSVYVTLRTGDLDVRTRQWERCHGAVIERSAGPRCCGVTLLTISREAGRCVVRISCLVEVRLMTTYACSGRAFVDPVHMALCACH